MNKTKSEITGAQRLMLAELDRRGAIDKKPNDATANALVRKGFVRRFGNDLVEITPAGREALRKAREEQRAEVLARAAAKG